MYLKLQHSIPEAEKQLSKRQKAPIRGLTTKMPPMVESSLEPELEAKSAVQATEKGRWVVRTQLLASSSLLPRICIGR